jgi:hypothetical protein
MYVLPENVVLKSPKVPSVGGVAASVGAYAKSVMSGVVGFGQAVAVGKAPPPVPPALVPPVFDSPPVLARPPVFVVPPEAGAPPVAPAPPVLAGMSPPPPAPPIPAAPPVAVLPPHVAQR